MVHTQKKKQNGYKLKTHSDLSALSELERLLKAEVLIGTTF